MLSAYVFEYLFYFIVRYVIVVGSKLAYNTFTQERTRATPYQPFVIDKTCLLKPDTGPCRSEIPMYYYDPSSKDCSIFQWGGCQGNGNRFDSYKACITSCQSVPNHPKTRPKWCSLTFDYGFCFGALNRWYYDPLWKVCKQRIYSGCGGNKNNFYNQEQCDAICRLGTGVLKLAKKDKSGIKKVIIVNHPNATKVKGRFQVSPSLDIKNKRD